MLRGMVDDQTAEVINLSNRVTIEIHTASFRVTRGYTFAAVLADETAFWRNEDSTNPNVEIFRALRPGLASIPGAMLLNASSPYRRTGVLYQAYAQHFGRDDARTLVWQAPTLAMNPTLDPDVIVRAFEDDPLSAAAEYGAEFRTDIADFISRAVVEACVEPGVFERPPSRIRRYSAFIDASGGSGSDSMTIAIAHSEDNIPTLDAIRERRPPFSPDAVVAEFSALLKSYRVTRAEADKWGGTGWARRFVRTASTSSQCEAKERDLYRDVAAIKRRALRVARPSASHLTALRPGASHVARRPRFIDHAPGGHDDLANAVAGALLLTGTRQPMRVSPRALERSR